MVGEFCEVRSRVELHKSGTQLTGEMKEHSWPLLAYQSHVPWHLGGQCGHLSPLLVYELWAGNSCACFSFLDLDCSSSVTPPHFLNSTQVQISRRIQGALETTGA